MFTKKSVLQKFSARHLNKANVRFSRTSSRVLAQQLVALKEINQSYRANHVKETATVIRRSWGAGGLLTSV
jgi:hypothetical protein